MQRHFNLSTSQAPNESQLTQEHDVQYFLHEKIRRDKFDEKVKYDGLIILNNAMTYEAGDYLSAVEE